MSLLFAMLIGCSNVMPPEWGGGGSRYALGQAGSGGSDDTGGEDTGSTGTSPDGPVLGTYSAAYTEPNEADEVFIEAGIAYDDDPDDLEGGRLFYGIYVEGELQSEGERTLVDANADSNTEALAVDGTLTVVAGPVDPAQENVLTLYVLDFTRNRSNEINIVPTTE